MRTGFAARLFALLLVCLPTTTWAVDGFVRVPPDSTGKQLDNEEIDFSGTNRYRQRVRIGGSLTNDLAAVVQTDPTTEWGLVVRNIPSGTQVVSGTINAVKSGTWSVDVGTHPCSYAENSTPSDLATGCTIHAVRADTPTATSDNGKRTVLQTDQDGSLWVTLNRVVTQQPRSTTSKEWHFTASQSENKIVSTTGTLTVTDAFFQCDPDTSVEVKYRLGFNSGASLSAESSSGVAGIVLKGWYKSTAVQGQAARFQGRQVGAAGEDLIFNMDAPTSGACSLIVAYIED